MSRLIFDADTLGGTTTLSSADAVGNFTITVPAVNGTLSVKDASDDATFRNITLTGAVLAGAWNGSAITVPYGGTGAVTLTGYVKGNGTAAMTASATIPSTDITGLGTMSVQNATAVAITGGTANSLVLGGTTAAAATVTTLRINSTLSLAGATGTSGQVLTSNGASAPTWQNIAGSGTVTSIDVSGGTTGLTTSGGPVTSTGTITLAGTLAIANGGTGATTDSAARTALGLGTMATQAASSVAITGGSINGTSLGATTAGSAKVTTLDIASGLTLATLAGTSGQVLTSAGAGVVPTWTTAATGTVTSVAGTGTVNGLTLTGTVTSSGSLTLGGTLSLAVAPAIGSTTPSTGAFTTLTASTSLIVADNVFTLQDNVDPTKQAQFELSGLTTGTTFSYTLPAVNTTLAGLASTNTFTATNNFGALNNSFGTYAGAATSTTGIAVGAQTGTKTVNVGTGGLSGSTTAIAIGSSVSGATSTTTMNGTSLFAGTGYSANFALTDAATVAWDSANQVATFTFVSSNRTMGAPTNLKNGAFYALAVIQNAGSNTLTWNSVFKWAAGTAPTLSTAAGAKDYFTFRSDGTNLYQQGISQAVA